MTIVFNQPNTLAARVQASFRQLSTVASELNNVSDELGKSIVDIDAALKKLNVGVSVWVNIKCDDSSEGDPSYYMEQLGYAKVGGKWGVALKTVFGHEQFPEDERAETWLFNDGPRELRLAAIEKLPEMLMALSKEAFDMSARIKNKLSDAQEVAKAITEAANPPVIRLAPRTPSVSVSVATDAAKGGKK
jgi:hypothetical protein